MSLERLVAARTEVSVPDKAEVWDLASEEAGQAFEVLSSDTARRTLACLYEDPQTASELAESLDTSLQNVDYHVQNLREAGLIEVATTRYSVTGNEMKVYAPTTNAVLLLSKESTAQRIRSRLARLFSTLLFIGIGALAFRSLIVGTVIDIPQVEIFAGEPDEDGTSGDDSADSQGGVTDESAAGDSAEYTSPDDRQQLDAAPESMDYVETINPLEHLPWLLDPGVAFVLGAIFAVVLVVALHRTVWQR